MQLNSSVRSQNIFDFLPVIVEVFYDSLRIAIGCAYFFVRHFSPIVVQHIVAESPNVIVCSLAARLSYDAIFGGFVNLGLEVSQLIPLLYIAVGFERFFQGRAKQRGRRPVSVECGA